MGVAASRFYPQLNFTGDGGYEKTDSPDRRNAGKDPLDAARSKATLTMTQNVFDGFGRISGHTQAEITKTAASANLRSVRQSILLEGVNAYLSVLRDNRLVGLATENERTISQQLNLEDERVQRGAGIAVDVLLAKARLQIAKERRVAFEGARVDSRSRFRQVFDIEVEPQQLVEPQLPRAIVPESLEAAVGAALKGNPSVERASQFVRLGDERRRGAESGYWPRVDIVGRGNFERDVEGTVGTQRDAAVVLQLTWDLFSGFGTRYAVKQAAEEAAVQRESEANTRRKTVEEVRLAWQSLRTAMEREALLINAANIASEVFEARKSLRDSGRETAINVLDAENEVYTARINLVSANFDAQFAMYRLLAAIGDMEVETFKKIR